MLRRGGLGWREPLHGARPHKRVRRVYGGGVFGLPVPVGSEGSFDGVVKVTTGRLEGVRRKPGAGPAPRVGRLEGFWPKPPRRTRAFCRSWTRRPPRFGGRQSAVSTPCWALLGRAGGGVRGFEGVRDGQGHPQRGRAVAARGGPGAPPFLLPFPSTFPRPFPLLLLAPALSTFHARSPQRLRPAPRRPPAGRSPLPAWPVAAPRRGQGHAPRRPPAGRSPRPAWPVAVPRRGQGHAPAGGPAATP